MALFRDDFDRSARTYNTECRLTNESGKLRAAKEITTNYFAGIMSLLPENVRPRHDIVTPKDAAPYIRYFATPELVDHLDSPLMKRALGAASRSDSKIREQVKTAQETAKAQEAEAIAEARGNLSGKLKKPYTGRFVARDQAHVVTALIDQGYGDLVKASAPLTRVLKRSMQAGLTQEHFAKAAKKQSPSSIAAAIMEARRKREEEQQLAA